MQITIPVGLNFSALRLARKPGGAVSFEIEVIEQIERASGLEPGVFMAQDEGAVAEPITTWYAQHRAAGGEPDATAEDLLAEIRAEDLHGGGLSHQPGRA